jgi:hypothetical protein
LIGPIDWSGQPPPQPNSQLLQVHCAVQQVTMCPVRIALLCVFQQGEFKNTTTHNEILEKNMSKPFYKQAEEKKLFSCCSFFVLSRFWPFSA